MTSGNLQILIEKYFYRKNVVWKESDGILVKAVYLSVAQVCNHSITTLFVVFNWIIKTLRQILCCNSQLNPWM